MTTSYSGDSDLRKEVVDGMLKQILPKKFVMRQLVSVVSTGAWKNTFWREDPTTLTGTTTSGITRNSFKEIGRGSAFPKARVAFEEVTTRILEFGAEADIAWQDVISDEIDVENRSLIRVSEGIADAEDKYIWDTLTESRSPTNIQSITIAAHYHWTGSSGQIIDNLMNAKEKLKDYNYDTSNVVAVISQRDERAIVKWVTDKGAQFMKVSENTALNGEVPGLVGFRFVVSPNVTASYALVVVPQRCGTLRVLEDLKTRIKDDEGKNRNIRAWEHVTMQLNEPKACVLISNTQGYDA